jgi:hypothetical protein
MGQPITRLFLSADIAGSTAYKQKKMSAEPIEWPSIFIRFFQGLPGTFRNELAEVEAGIKLKSSNFQPAEDAQMWKAIGDELVIWQEVTDESQVAASVIAWSQAIQQFRRGLKEESLDVKGAAWLGSFPDPNREIAIPKTIKAATDPGQPVSANEINLQKDDHILDFIGPHIDAGFRLAARSSPRRMYISMDVAQVLASVPEDHLPSVSMFYEGAGELKGVQGGRPYPFFWLDCDPGDGFAKAEDALLGRKKVDYKNVRELVENAFKPSGTSCIWLSDAVNVGFREAAADLFDRAGQIQSYVNEFPEKPITSTDPQDAGLPKDDQNSPDVAAKVAELQRPKNDRPADS